mgnify:CR=1 FL=1
MRFMNYEAGYYLVFKWVMIIFILLSMGFVGWIYVKRAIKRDITENLHEQIAKQA